MNRVDRVFSLVVIALGLGAVVESWRMPRMTALGAEPYSAPGIVPGLIGLILVGLGTVLWVRSHARIRRQSPSPRLPALNWPHFFLAAALTVTYAVGLIGRVPFVLATALFVTGFIVVFERRRGWPLLSALIQGVVVAVVVAGVFRYVFLVRLP